MFKISFPKVEKRPIPGYEGKYSATSDGHIWSHINNQYLAEFENNSGYLRVGLGQGDGSQKKELVERLVALAFLDNPDPEHLTDVDHINQNTWDNRVKNLRWIDKLGNACNTDRVFPVVDMQDAYEYHSIAEASRATGIEYDEIMKQVKESKKKVKDKEIGKLRFKYSDTITRNDIHRLMDICYKVKFHSRRPYESYYICNSNPEYGFCKRFFSDHILYPIPYLKRRKLQKEESQKHYIVMNEAEFAIIQKIFKVCNVKESFAEYRNTQKGFDKYYDLLEKFVSDVYEGNIADDKALSSEYGIMLIPPEKQNIKIIADLGEYDDSIPLKVVQNLKP